MNNNLPPLRRPAPSPRPGQAPQPAQPPPVDPWGETVPTNVPPPVYLPVEPRRGRSRPQPKWPGSPPPPRWAQPRPRFSCAGCLPLFLLAGLLIACLAVIAFAPWRTNILLLGIDYAPGESTLSRSDTIILATFDPFAPYVRLLSIPRDLWVIIPEVGENRINTAHFFGEAQQPGSGPRKALETVRSNFGIDVGYYVRIRFEGFRDVVDALGGVDITLKEPAAGYDPGTYHLTGRKALAFVRQRYGSDDFFRMEHGQLMLKAILRQMANPFKWPRLPAVVFAALRSLDTNAPPWVWPRLAAALLRVGPEGIDNRTIRREMVTPFTTNEGASVLLPDWNQINPLLLEMFGQ